LQKQIVSNNIDFKNVSKFEEKGDPWRFRKINGLKRAVFMVISMSEAFDSDLLW
jgi:hypothetical protein